MKKLILGVLVVLTGAASATSIRNVRLELKTSPIHRAVRDGATTYIHIFADGQVRGTKCPAKQFGGCESVELDQLRPREMRQLERLIAQARVGEIKLPDPRGIRCMAMPFRTSSYTAANGTVLLRSGAFPCGLVTVNESPAARELVEMLDGYNQEFSRSDLLSAPEVEELG